MSFSDQEISRLREAFASQAHEATERADCPEPERLWQATHGELPTAEIQDLVDHTASCPSCAEDWRLAHELAFERQPTVGKFPTRQSKVRTTWWSAAAAAALLVLVSSPLWRVTRPADPPDVVRAPGESAAIQSLIPDDVVLSRADCVLRWSSGPAPVASYKILVSTESFDVLIRQEGLQEPTFLVPPEALEQVPTGDSIFWQVEAIGPSDRRLVSPTFVQRLE